MSENGRSFRANGEIEIGIDKRLFAQTMLPNKKKQLQVAVAEKEMTLFLHADLPERVKPFYDNFNSQMTDEILSNFPEAQKEAQKLLAQARMLETLQTILDSTNIKYLSNLSLTPKFSIDKRITSLNISNLQLIKSSKTTINPSR